MPSSWDAEQIRISAEQVAETMLDRMTERHPELRGASAGDHLLKWSPLVIAFLTAFWLMAVTSTQVAQNARYIDAMKSRVENSATTTQSIDTRLARIETTLNIITGGEGNIGADGNMVGARGRQGRTDGRER
jgi:hypothetical protein